LPAPLGVAKIVDRPDGIVTVGDVRERERVLEPPSAGQTWSHAFLTEATFGPRFGEAVGLGAGTGVCKSTLLIQEMASDLGAGHSVGAFLLAQSPAETTRGLAAETAAAMDAGRRWLTEQSPAATLGERLTKLSYGPAECRDG